MHEKIIKLQLLSYNPLYHAHNLNAFLRYSILSMFIWAVLSRYVQIQIQILIQIRIQAYSAHIRNSRPDILHSVEPLQKF